jgi:hypothetical protein
MTSILLTFTHVGIIVADLEGGPRGHTTQASKQRKLEQWQATLEIPLEVRLLDVARSDNLTWLLR